MFVVLFYGIRRLPCIFYSVPHLLDFPIIIWKFPVAENIFKNPHLCSILISRVECVDKFGVIHYFITPMGIFYHGISLVLHQPIYFIILLGVIMIMQEGVSHESQWVNRWDFSSLSGVLTTVNNILCIGIDSFIIGHYYLAFFPPSSLKCGLLQQFMVPG